MKLLRIALFVCVFMLVASSRLEQHGHRDATMLFLAHRHGLRVSELVALYWEQADLQGGVLRVRRRRSLENDCGDSPRRCRRKTRLSHRCFRP